MERVVLVRHGPTMVEPDVPQDQWRLSPEGENIVRSWAECQSWDGVTQLYTSPEAKAVETAAMISQTANIPVAGIDDGLRELRVPFIASRGEFLARMERYLGGFPDPDFEPWESAQARIHSSIHAIQARHAGQSIAVVSHGRILTAYLSGILSRRLSEREWLAIQMPDSAVVDMEAGRVLKGFAQWPPEVWE